MSGAGSKALLGDADMEPWLHSVRWLLTAVEREKLGTIVDSGDTKALRLGEL